MSFRNNLNSEGFTGLEAAIVLIAFIVVASVFSFVVLGAGFFTTQKSQETIYKSVEQTSTNIDVVGSVYGIKSTESPGIDEICFTITRTPGSPTIDLDKMMIVFSTPATKPVTLTRGTTASCSTFTANDAGENAIVSEDTEVEITPYMPTIIPVTLRPFRTPGGSQITLVEETDIPSDTSIQENQLVDIIFYVEPIQPYTKMNIEIRPGVGAAITLSKTAPATLTHLNVLRY
jgi:flagellin FlaB